MRNTGLIYQSERADLSRNHGPPPAFPSKKTLENDDSVAVDERACRCAPVARVRALSERRCCTVFAKIRSINDNKKAENTYSDKKDTK